ncbi:type II toxin-antitoxin system HicB family antitoxin [Oceanispirochaeta sp.]|jgi:antitoxin HicB|uniref:type II toxin-antitoxin system HicB family antitoxin n=1 Tax=Oceanispirochaeta sp. TaxID=2035350 RepID=UPI00261DD1AA|nr:type II toxin-antitoxin system HicB family antitoxin [Oceanispirochaeta sp.]MDA3958889.1 type II toxin-antitoxin system HicB family antitoxin [Oceanispirochaeta sp.]
MKYKCRLKHEEKGYFVEFPDLNNVFTEGKSIEEALENAYEALNGVLEVEVSHGQLPAPPSAEGKDLYPIEVAPHIEIAIQLRNLRGRRSQKNIAEKLGLSYQAYQRLENPLKGNPTIKTLEKIAKALGLNLTVTLSA